MRIKLRERQWVRAAVFSLTCCLAGCSSWGDNGLRMPALSWPGSSARAVQPAAEPRPAGVPVVAPPATPSGKSSASFWRGPSRSEETDELNLPALMGKGRMLERTGDWDKARETYAVAVRRFPNDAAPYHRLGVVADQQRRYLEAEQQFAEAIQRDPRNAEQFNDLGYCFYLQGQLVRAESALLKATQLDPKNARFQNNYGMVLAHQGRIEPALEAFRQAGSEADAQYNLAFVFASKDQTDQAKLCFRKALAADPQHEAARKALQSFELYEQMPPDQRDFEVAGPGTRWIPYREPHESNPTATAANSASSGVQQAAHQAATGSQRPARNAAQAQFLESRGLLNQNRTGQR